MSTPGRRARLPRVPVSPAPGELGPLPARVRERVLPARVSLRQPFRAVACALYVGRMVRPAAVPLSRSWRCITARHRVDLRRPGRRDWRVALSGWHQEALPRRLPACRQQRDASRAALRTVRTQRARVVSPGAARRRGGCRRRRSALPALCVRRVRRPLRLRRHQRASATRGRFVHRRAGIHRRPQHYGHRVTRCAGPAVRTGRMSLYTPEDERRIRAQALVRDWTESAMLDPEQGAALEGELRVDVRRTNGFLRAGLALFTAFIVAASAMLMVEVLDLNHPVSLALAMAVSAVVCLWIAHYLIAH